MSKRNQQKIKPIRVDGTPDRETIPTRTGSAQVVGANGPNSAIWKATPEVQVAGTKVIAAGAALAEADTAVQSLQQQLATALNVRDAKVVEFDAVHSVYVATVEAHATTPQDVTGLGLALFAKSTHAFVAPLGVDATFDAAKGRVHIHVNKAPGMQASVVEVSSDPRDPAGWRRLPGFGAIHKLSGYAPGTCWVRAASARANEISDFTEPVPVMVK
jgi:hypothetical protein